MRIIKYKNSIRYSILQLITVYIHNTIQAQQILASAKAYDVASKKLKMLRTLIRSPSELVLTIPSPSSDSYFVLDPAPDPALQPQVTVIQNDVISLHLRFVNPCNLANRMVAVSRSVCVQTNTSMTSITWFRELQNLNQH